MKAFLPESLTSAWKLALVRLMAITSGATMRNRAATAFEKVILEWGRVCVNLRCYNLSRAQQLHAPGCLPLSPLTYYRY